MQKKDKAKAFPGVVASRGSIATIGKKNKQLVFTSLLVFFMVKVKN